MNLHDLVQGLINEDILKNVKNEPIKGITDTSVRVLKGFLFVAIKGHNSDGHIYIQEAIKHGASVIVGEEDLLDLSVPYVKVENSRKLLGMLFKRFYQDPSKDKVMIGITGTNGKTTTSFLLKHILEQNGSFVYD